MSEKRHPNNEVHGFYLRRHEREDGARAQTIRRQRAENTLSHARHHYAFRHIIWHVHRKINAKRSHFGSFFARLAKVEITLLEISKSHLFLHITANQLFTNKSAINNQLISYKTSSDSSVFSYLFISSPFLAFELTLLTFSIPKLY